MGMSRELARVVLKDNAAKNRSNTMRLIGRAKIVILRVHMDGPSFVLTAIHEV
jgi:hypothetical protein